MIKLVNKSNKNIFSSLLVLIILCMLVSTSVFAADTDEYEIGTQNLNNTSENSAIIKDVLLKPEIGWKRYDDSNSKISYIITKDVGDGNPWLVESHASLYNGSRHRNENFGKVAFKFSGTKLRIIANMDTHTTMYGIGVYIDGKLVKAYNQYQLPTEYAKDQMLACEITELSEGDHTVLLVNDSRPGHITLDAIDIDENGELKPLVETTTLRASAGDKEVTLNWDIVADATGYNVKMSTNPGGPYTTVANNTANSATSFKVNNLQNGTKYYFIVTALKGIYESSPSNEVSATPQEPIPAPSAPTNLTATADNKVVNLSWDSVIGAASYNVKRSETAGGPYTTIASSVTEAVYSDTTAVSNITYYYVVSAVNTGGESQNSNEASAKITYAIESISVEAIKDKVKIGNEFTTDIVFHGGTNICAEDIRITYNTELFEYLGYEETQGLKVYKEIKDNAGNIRFIIASLGKQNAINGDKELVKLKFRAKKAGKDKVDVIRARIADKGTIEKDLLEENCGEKEITVEANLDVNRSGEFTLLDLGIDAWYYGDAVADTDTTKYDTDVVINGMVDNADLVAIVAEMLNNPNYLPNN